MNIKSGLDATWKFDQAENVACVTCKSVIDGAPVLTVCHYEDDHSWAFLDGKPFNSATAMIVGMGEVINRHPDLIYIADLLPGWSATRTAAGQPWSKEPDHWDAEDQ